MKTDEELQKDVMEELRWEPLLKDIAPHIGVTASDGVVTLSGLVDTYSKKLAAERAAQRVQGVKVVAIDLEIKLEKMDAISDIEIAGAVRNALRWYSAVNSDKVEVMVDAGWVYLSGTVDWEYERRSTAHAVRHLVGVRGVTNNIKIKSGELDAKEIRRKIAAAFHRSATVDSSAVHVEVTGSHVALYGKVRSLAEKKDAEKIAWASPGITAVDNHLEIETSLFVV